MKKVVGLLLLMVAMLTLSTVTVVANEYVPRRSISLNRAGTVELTERVVGFLSSPTLEVKVTNTASMETSPLSFRLEGPGAANFRLTSAGVHNLAPDGTATFFVEAVTGLREGDYNVTVIVTDDGVLYESFKVHFTVAPPPTVGIEIGEYLEFVLPTLNPGQTPISDSFVIRNSGSSVMTNGKVTITGSDAACFDIDSQNGTNVTTLPNISAGHNIRFGVVPVDGLMPGTYRATLTVTADNAVSQSIDVVLSVRDSQPKIEIGMSGMSGTLALNWGAPGYTCINLRYSYLEIRNVGGAPSAPTTINTRGTVFWVNTADHIHYCPAAKWIQVPEEKDGGGAVITPEHWIAGCTCCDFVYFLKNGDQLLIAPDTVYSASETSEGAWYRREFELPSIEPGNFIQLTVSVVCHLDLRAHVYRGFLTADSAGSPSARQELYFMTRPTPEARSLMINPRSISLFGSNSVEFEHKVLDQWSILLDESLGVDWVWLGWDNQQAAPAQITPISGTGRHWRISAGNNPPNGTLNLRAIAQANTSVMDTIVVDFSFPTPTRVELTSTADKIAPGSNFQFGARIIDQFNAVMGAQTVTWGLTSASGPLPNGTSVSNTGLVTIATTHASDTLMLTATSTANPALIATATINVAPPPKATSVTIIGTDRDVEAGKKYNFRAEVLDQDGNLFTSQSVTWQVVAGSAVVTSGTAYANGVLTIAQAQVPGTIKLRVTVPGTTPVIEDTVELTIPIPAAPRVKQLSPADGAVNIQTHANMILVQFDRPVNPASGTIKLIQGNAWQWDWAGTGTQLGLSQPTWSENNTVATMMRTSGANLGNTSGSQGSSSSGQQLTVMAPGQLHTIVVSGFTAMPTSEIMATSYHVFTTAWEHGSGWYPDAPFSLKATPGSNEVKLEWERASTTGNVHQPQITGWQVQVDGGSWVTISASASGGSSGQTGQYQQYSHKVTGLENDKLYHFRVRAINANGVGASSGVDAIPRGPIVGGTPRNLIAQQENNNRVVLSWLAPLTGDHIAAVTGYEASMDGGATWVGTGTNLTYTFNDLTPGQRYQFAVRAITNIGATGNAWISVTMGTPTTAGDWTSPVYDYTNLTWVYNNAAAIPLPFTDVPMTTWYREAIAIAWARGLVTGMTPTTFVPELQVTRAMFVDMLFRLAGSPTGQHNRYFVDMADHAFYNQVHWAYENKIVVGIGEQMFAPDSLVTREQMAVMLSNYAQSFNIYVPQIRSPLYFPDQGSVSWWAAGAVDQMTRAGVLNGYDTGYFHPQESATRAHAAQVIVDFLRLLGK